MLALEFFARSVNDIKKPEVFSLVFDEVHAAFSIERMQSPGGIPTTQTFDELRQSDSIAYEEMLKTLIGMGFQGCGDKLNLDFCYSDINMGNEDTYTLCFDPKRHSFDVEHRFSHRKSGSSYDFESRREPLDLPQLMQEHGSAFASLRAKLKSLHFEER